MCADSDRFINAGKKPAPTTSLSAAAARDPWPSLQREGIGDRGLRIDEYALGFQIFVDRFEAVLTPNAGFLEAAEGER